MQIGAMGRATANKIAESLFAQDTKKLQDGIGEYLKKSISFYDAGAEGRMTSGGGGSNSAIHCQ
jgi:hypothetical protein